MIVSFRLPRISLGAVSNLVGLLGLIAIAIAVGGLTGNWWWSLLAGGTVGVVVAYLAGLTAQADAAEQQAKKELAPVVVPVAKAS